jgi:hypothetical protein
MERRETARRSGQRLTMWGRNETPAGIGLPAPLERNQTMGRIHRRFLPSIIVILIVKIKITVTRR